MSRSTSAAAALPSTSTCSAAAFGSSTGQRVRRGDVIAKLGSSGSTSIGPHLHFHVADANSDAGRRRPAVRVPPLHGARRVRSIAGAACRREVDPWPAGSSRRRKRGRRRTRSSASLDAVESAACASSSCLELSSRHWSPSSGRGRLPRPADDAPQLAYITTAHQLGVVGYRDPAGAISPDGKRFAYSEGRFIRVIPIGGGAPVTLPPADQQVRSLTWTSNDTVVAVPRPRIVLCDGRWNGGLRRRASHRHSLRWHEADARSRRRRDWTDCLLLPIASTSRRRMTTAWWRCGRPTCARRKRIVSRRSRVMPTRRPWRPMAPSYSRCSRIGRILPMWPSKAGRRAS